MAYRKPTDDTLAEPTPSDSNLSSEANSAPAASPDASLDPSSAAGSQSGSQSGPVANSAARSRTARPGTSGASTPGANADTDATNPGDLTAGTAQSTDAAAARTLEVENVVKNHVIVALSLGLVPLPLFDLALLTGNSVVMVRSLSQLYEVPFEEHRVQAIIVSLVGGSLPVLGVVSLSAGAKLLPGIGTLFGSGTVAVTGGALTYAIAQVFMRHFEGGGTLLDFDAAKLRERFRREVAKGKAVVAEVGEAATNGTAKP